MNVKVTTQSCINTGTAFYCLLVSFLHFFIYLSWSLPMVCGSRLRWYTQGDSGGICNTLGNDSMWTFTGDRIPVEVRFSAPAQTGLGAHPGSYTVGTVSFPGVKRSERSLKHPFQFNTEGWRWTWFLHLILGLSCSLLSVGTVSLWWPRLFYLGWY